MKKIEARTLEDAYMQAAFELGCSVTNLKYEVIQHPSNGLLGFMKKNAIIVAVCSEEESKEDIEIQSENKVEIPKTIEPEPIKEIQTKTPKIEDKKVNDIDKTLIKNDNDIIDNFFDSKSDNKENTIINEFEIDSEKDSITINELEVLITKDIEKLLSYSCYDIDIVEVTIDNSTAEIYLDGIDAALIIGKEGHRYNALSYMLFNWLQSKYNLYVKLEIAQFLASQKEMIKSYIKPVIEHINKNGRGKTRALDGILIQLALEELRAEFPNKYVAVKTQRDGDKYIVINDFSTPKKNV